MKKKLGIAALQREERPHRQTKVIFNNLPLFDEYKMRRDVPSWKAATHLLPYLKSKQFVT